MLQIVNLSSRQVLVTLVVRKVFMCDLHLGKDLRIKSIPVKFLRYDLNASSDYYALRSYFSLLAL